MVTAVKTPIAIVCWELTMIMALIFILLENIIIMCSLIHEKRMK